MFLGLSNYNSYNFHSKTVNPGIQYTMLSNIIRVSIPVGTVAGTLLSGARVQNESKRKFYEDESQITPIPGTVTPASGTELEVLGSNRIIDGISVRSSTSIENGFKNIREMMISKYNSVRATINTKYSQMNETEKSITKTVGNLHNKSEDLLPNSIYIIVAGLSGTIAAQRRGIIAKLIFPLVTGSIAFKYFLPNTFKNTTGFLWDLEKKNLPQLADSQDRLIQEADTFITKTEETAVKSKAYIEDKSKSLKKSLVEITGLNVDEQVSKK